MSLTNKEFTNLCDRFSKAADGKVEQLHDEIDKVMTDPVDYQMHKNSIRSSQAVMFGTGVKMASIFLLKLPFYLIAARLPGSPGAYFKEKAENDPSFNLGYVFAEHAAGMQLAGGVHPMRIAEQMPEEMKTPEGLDCARKAKLKAVAEVIQYHLDC